MKETLTFKACPQEQLVEIGYAPNKKMITVLETIAQMKQVSTKNIFVLHYQGKTYESKEIRTCRNNLDLLWKKGFLLKVARKEMEEVDKRANNLYMLSKEGLIILNQELNTKYSFVDKTSYSFVQLIHKKIIRDVCTNIKYHYGDKVKIALEKTFEIQDLKLIPDLRVLMKTANFEKHLFIEVDFKQAINQDFRTKIAKYLRLIDNKENIFLIFITNQKKNMNYVINLKHPAILCAYRPDLSNKNFLKEYNWIK